jgi:putative peptidoglycan lipid II flippase
MKKWLTKANKRVSFGGAATMLVTVALAGQILGFFRNRLISTNFTVNDPGSTDAFFAAFLIPDFFFYTIAAGALGVAFIPFLADKIASNDRKGLWELTTSILNTMAIVMFFVSVIIFVFAETLIHKIVAPDLDPEHLAQATTIMRLISLNPFFFTVSGILTAVQQSFGRFFFYAMAPIVYNAAIIGSIFIFRDSIGVIGLGFGALGGAVLQLLVAGLGLIGLGFAWNPKILWRKKDFKEVLRQLPARSLDQGIDSINSIVETNRAQKLGEGSVSYYNYALTLHNVPIMLIGTSIATAAFPRLSERLAQKRPDLFNKDFLEILRGMIWISMPVLVVCYFCRGYLARIISGTPQSEISLIFGYLVGAIFFRTVYSIMSRWFYAQKDTKTPLFVSIFAIALNIYLAFTLARPDAYGIAGLAIAQSLVAFAEVLVLGIVMVLRERRLLNMKFWGGIGRILSVTGFSVMAAYIMISILPLNLTDVGIVTLGTKLGFISLVTLGVHMGVSAIFGLEEVRPVISKVKQLVLSPLRLQ